MRIDRRQELTTKIDEKDAIIAEKGDAGTLAEKEMFEAAATAAYKVAGWLEALAAGL
jgi:hypothetical protein